jgi:tetratricopeptide (TPR) repeat protein
MGMGRTGVTYLLLGVLGPLAGCQLIPRENLAASASTAESGPAKGELPPRAAAEVCQATARAFDKEGNEAQVITLYEKARQNGANTQQTSRRLAYLYEHEGDFKRAMEEYKQLLQRNSKDADLLNDVGYCYYNQGDWVEAEKHLRQAIAINPKHARAWINLGMTLAQTYRAADSLEAFTQVVSPAQAQCNLAFILQTQGRFEDAKAAYRQALAQEPNLAVARGQLAKLERASTAAAPATAAVPFPAAAPRNQEAAPEIVEEQTPVEVGLP